MSTEHQQYSTENQSAKVKEYAEQRGIEIVRTYSDEGKSGLRIDGRAALQRLIQLEVQREKIVAELHMLEAAQKAADVLRTISERDVRKLLSSLAEHLQEVDREALKELIGGMVERVELCSTALTARLHYKIATGDLLASPRGFEPRFTP